MVSAESTAYHWGRGQASRVQVSSRNVGTLMNFDEHGSQWSIKVGSLEDFRIYSGGALSHIQQHFTHE
jgi:hypothetical protein